MIATACELVASCYMTTNDLTQSFVSNMTTLLVEL